jgi:cytochrome P450
VIAGNGTTTALIGNAVFHILRHPDQARLLVDEPERIANAVEEALRFEAPLPTDRRLATRTLTLGDQTIAEGDLVMSVLAAANRDPEHFPDPDTFDVTRSFREAHHVAFGRGIHLCLGAPVARLEATVGLETLFERFGLARIPDGFEPDWHAITTHRGLKTLPIERER